MNVNIAKSNAATGKTAMVRSMKLVGGQEIDVFTPDAEYGEIRVALENLANVCIDFTKEGKTPYAYSTFEIDGVRYGLSVSLHYDEGKIYSISDFFCPDATPDEDFMESARNYVSSYIANRGLVYAKSFVSKVKRNGVSVRDVMDSTEYLYYNTAA